MNDELSKIIGERINLLLISQNIKQKDLAAALEVTDNTISYFVSGKRMPNTVQIKKIAEFFNVSADYLLGLSDVPTTDKDLQFVCDYVHLNETSVNSLHEASKTYKDLLDFLFNEFGLVGSFRIFCDEVIFYSDWYDKLQLFKYDTANKHDLFIYDNHEYSRTELDSLFTIEEIEDLVSTYEDIHHYIDLSEFRLHKSLSSLAQHFCSKKFKQFKHKIIPDDVFEEIYSKLNDIYCDYKAWEYGKNGNDTEAQG